MALTLSERAAHELKTLLEESGIQDAGLRVRLIVPDGRRDGHARSGLRQLPLLRVDSGIMPVRKPT